MLLTVKNKNKAELEKLFAFAQANSIEITIVDEDLTKTYLPGKVLSKEEQKKLIEQSKLSGKIKMTKAHKHIIDKLNGD